MMPDSTRLWSKRAHALFSFGLLFAVYGVSLFRVTEARAATGILREATRLMPASMWGVVWIVAAAMALFQSFHKRTKHIPPTAWATIASVAWTWSALAVVAVFDAPALYVTNVLTAAIWFLVADIVTLLSGWVDETGLFRDEPSHAGFRSRFRK